MANGNSNPNINRGINCIFHLSCMVVNPFSSAPTVFENRESIPMES